LECIRQLADAKEFPTRADGVGNSKCRKSVILDHAPPAGGLGIGNPVFQVIVVCFAKNICRVEESK